MKHWWEYYLVKRKRKHFGRINITVLIKWCTCTELRDYYCWIKCRRFCPIIANRQSLFLTNISSYMIYMCVYVCVYVCVCMCICVCVCVCVCVCMCVNHRMITTWSLVCSLFCLHEYLGMTDFTCWTYKKAKGKSIRMKPWCKRKSAVFTIEMSSDSEA